MTQARIIRADERVTYPERDGKPMGETDTHRIEMQSFVIDVLEDLFAAELRVYVSGNNFIYYIEGDPTKSVSPDAYVVFGVPKRARRVFKIWEEGSTPRVVFEITSAQTRSEDRGAKMEIYAELGVRELYLFDPFEEWVKQGLRAFRLEDGFYVPIIPSEGRVRSEALGVDLGVVDGHLRFFDPRTRAVLPTRLEAIEAAELKADEARRRAIAADERAEVERQRAEAERQRAEAERVRAKAADERADQERSRAEEALALVAKLEERLARSSK
ncbi:MAG: Uma2 family endonuclease [Deltaproteobacteria bacterium]|nr:Uma2 family endonuclease [Deltaproteobacteria bacterium]